MPEVTLHEIKLREELEPLCRIAASAWQNDPLFSWLFPGGQTHPEDFLILWKIILDMEFLEPGKFIFAASIYDAETQTNKIAGFAVWERRGDSEAARRWQGTSFSKKLGRLNLSLKLAHTVTLSPARRSFSRKKFKLLDEEVESVRARQPKESWYLNFLGVDPTAQKKGVGKRLLQWGLDRADEEGIAAGLEASNAGVKLYQSAGFETTEWMNFDDGKQKQSVMRRECKLRSP
ncbi:hypothetical protein P175DRAFT_0426071 [Aspergillus ochraceoroseus IBT 24754]|nr:uncharacterized protein P175DRAFT_0426071 [Aspergillus ochraceoroseus IBT 24754]KKK17222.1 hypothetical protein AOCH_004671 [Aspergillus ochraceoroseus]PTU25478.1 hypothetical protein P175DRAFT_0426071 [Aspergillus ochraceoroseus IBT 24754]